MYSHLTESKALQMSSLKRSACRWSDLVEPASKAPHIHKVVVNASLFDKDTLRVEDESVHVRAKAYSENLHNKLPDFSTYKRDPLRKSKNKGPPLSNVY